MIPNVLSCLLTCSAACLGNSAKLSLLLRVSAPGGVRGAACCSCCFIKAIDVFKVTSALHVGVAWSCRQDEAAGVLGCAAVGACVFIQISKVAIVLFVITRKLARKLMSSM